MPSGQNEFEATGTNPVDQFADLHGLVAVVKRIRYTPFTRPFRECRSAQHVRLYIDHHQLLCAIDGLYRMSDARDRIAGCLDDALDANVLRTIHSAMNRRDASARAARAVGSVLCGDAVKRGKGASFWIVPERERVREKDEHEIDETATSGMDTLPRFGTCSVANRTPRRARFRRSAGPWVLSAVAEWEAIA